MLNKTLREKIRTGTDWLKTNDKPIIIVLTVISLISGATWAVFTYINPLSPKPPSAETLSLDLRDNNSDITINYSSVSAFEQNLGARELALHEKLNRVQNDAERRVVEKQIVEIRQWILDPEKAYQQQKAQIKDLQQKLNELKGIDDVRLEKTQQALQDGNLTEADALLVTISSSEALQKSVHTLATTEYSEG